MRLILCRHGNTFLSGEQAVWLGGSIDPPLTAEGISQSIRLARALGKANILPRDVFCGPFVRMYSFAKAITTRLRLSKPPVVDQRLTEIDYGRWNGLSNEEVVKRFGGREFYDWYERNIWPSSAWISEEGAFHAAVESFIRHMREGYNAGETVVAITGHGPLKCLGVQMRDSGNSGLSRGWHRVDTGNICELTCSKERIQVIHWNETPDMVLGGAPTCRRNANPHGPRPHP